VSSRRQFITLLGVAVMAWPITAGAQQPTMPVIGYLGAGSPEADANLITAFRKGLGEAGFVEGRNVAIEFRWAHNDTALLPGLAVDLVRRRVQVIVTTASTPAASAAKAASTTIPIVFSIGTDPVRVGLVASLNHPGANITGATTMSVELTPKRLEILSELLPSAARFAVLVNPNNPLGVEPVTDDVRAAAVILAQQIEIRPAATNRDIDTVFAYLVEKRTAAVLFTPARHQDRILIVPINFGNPQLQSRPPKGVQ
jgi:putative tryptophan/tyrosine transport system substrate-binding protein